MIADDPVILVVDVESTCWQGQPPPGEQSEIIEIGICALDSASGELLEQESILVRPERSKVSPFCTELTTLTQEMVDAGIWFAEACERLRTHYRGPERTWASWGDYDRKMFEAQCAQRGIPYPFSAEHINSKKRFAAAYRLKRPEGMAGALKHLCWPLQGTHHRGEDDAVNIARILGHLLVSGE